LLIAGAAALVWGLVLLGRGGLVGGCLAVLLAGTCFGYPLIHWSIGPLPITIDRILWVVVIGQYVVWRWLGKADPKPAGRAEIALGAFVVVLAASTLTHDWQVRNSQPLARLVFDYLMPCGLYWVARQSRITERGILAVLAFLAATGFYLALVALAEVSGNPGLVFPRSIASPELPEFLGRARGPLLNPAGNGILLGLGLAATLLGWPRLGRIGRVGVILASLVLCAGVYATLTRSAWFGAILGAVIVVGLAVPRPWRPVVIGGTLLAALVVIVTQWDRLVTFKRDRALAAEETAESAKLRPILAAVAWQMFCDRPLWGCGFGQYPERSVEYLADRSIDLPLEKARPFVQHNVLLALLTETGLAGMGLFVLLLGIWIGDAWRLWRSADTPLWARQQALLFFALLGNYLLNGMFQDVSKIPMIHMWLFFAAGLTAGLRDRLARPLAAGVRAQEPAGRERPG
jgi:O-antigen ligase